MKTHAAIGMAALLTLLTACEQAVYLPGPNTPRPQGGFVNSELWAAARGDTPGRMKLIGSEDPGAQDGNRTLYRTLWRSPTNQDETYLICIQEPGGALGSFTQWGVFVYDKHNQQIMHGTVSFAQMTPLGIVEVKADTTELPEELRDEWQLAVVASRTDNAQAPLSGLKLQQYPADPFVDIELVRWDDAWVELPFGSGNLNERDIRSIEYRQAEPGLSVTPEGRLQFKR